MNGIVPAVRLAFSGLEALGHGNKQIVSHRSADE